MEEKLPRFLRIMCLNSGFETKIHLPPLICKKLVQEQVILTSQKGNWVVKIHKSLDGKVWLTNGWEDFVKQHDISSGDFAVFEHIGKSGILSFNVMILDVTFCERYFNQQLGGQKLPPFIRIMFPRTDFDTKIHLLPLNCKKLVEQEPKEAILTSQKGIWKVKIDESEDGMLWFTKGWNDFVLEHGIAENHSLLFVHTGSSCFSVMLFDRSFCERDFHFQPKTSEKRGRTQANGVCRQGNPSVNIGHNNVFPSQVNIDSVKVEVDFDEVPPPVEVQKHKSANDKGNAKRGRPQGTGQGNSSQVNIPEHVASVKLEVDLDKVPSPVKIQKHKSAHDKGKGKAKRKREPKVVNVFSTEQHPQLVTTIKEYSIRGRSPYFHIPADFCKANGVYHDERFKRVILKGPMAEQEVSITVCSGGNTIYAIISSGWSDFVKANKLKIGDTCILQFRCR